MKPLFTIITTPAPDRDLVTLDDLREQLRYKPNDTANDIWLAKAITRTSRQTEGFCSRIFVVQGYQDVFPGNTACAQGEPLRLSSAPVDPTSFIVTIDGTSLVAGDYGLDQDAGLVYPLLAPLQWQSTVSLVAQYNAGFDPIPDDVQLAVLELCTMEVAGRGRDPMLRAKESPGLGREEFWVGGLPGGATIPQDIAGRLYPFIRGIVA